MFLIGVFSLLVAVLTLLISYLKYMRSRPKFEIFNLGNSLASTFSGFSASIKFSFKKEELDSLSSTTLILQNSGFRAIEMEDIRDEYPLEIFVEDGIIKDYVIEHQHGDSNIQYLPLNEDKIQLNIRSMDKGASVRLKLLISGHESIVKARGKIIGADKSISRIQNLHNPDLVWYFQDFFNSINAFFKAISLVFLGIFLFIFLIAQFDIESKATIYAPSDFYTQKDQLYKVDSIIDFSPKTTELLLLSKTDSNSIDTLQLEHLSSYINIRWGYSGDSVALMIRDSLKNLGYSVLFSSTRMSENGSNGKRLYNFYKSPHTIMVKDSKISDYMEYLGYSLLISFVICSFCSLLIIIGFASNHTLILSYRHYLSEKESQEIRENVPRSLSKFLFGWLIPTRFDHSKLANE